MKKTITYAAFIIVAILIIVAFVSAKTYTQLAIDIIIYPLFVLIAYKIFVRGTILTLPVKDKPSFIESQIPPAKTAKKNEELQYARVEVADVDKRTFLKIIGTVGLSYFIFSILGQKVGSLFSGKALNSGIGQLGLAPQNESVTAGGLTTEGYTISEIDDTSPITYYGFVNKDGAWFIMKEDVEGNTYRYAKGNSDFSNNWKGRDNLKYDYYFNLF
jgi:hypothetical protein